MVGHLQPYAAQIHSQELKEFFREVHGEHEISFPEQLPVSALVGCVTVMDVLTVCSHLTVKCLAASSSGVEHQCFNSSSAADQQQSGPAKAGACFMLVGCKVDRLQYAH